MKKMSARAGKTATKPKAAKKSTILRMSAKPPVGKGIPKPPKTAAQKNSKKVINKVKQQKRPTPPIERTVLRPARYERPGVSFPTIIRNTNPVPQIENSEFVRIRQQPREGLIRLPVTFGPQTGKYDRYYRGYRTYTRTIAGKGIRDWNQIIYARDHNYKGKIHTCPQIVVHCQCQDFVFGGWEYALWKHGAAQIIGGNGNAPTKNNTALKPGACKHIYIAYRELKKLGL